LQKVIVQRYIFTAQLIQFKVTQITVSVHEGCCFCLSACAYACLSIYLLLTFPKGSV